MARLKNRQHEHFCYFFVSNGFKGAAAARAARYGTANARQQAAVLITKPDIICRIDELNNDLLDGIAMSAAEAAAELGKMARFDIRDLYDSDGNFIPVHELPSEAAVSVQEFEVDDGMLTKIKAGRDKRGALDMIMKHYNWFEEHQSAGKAEMNIVISEKDERL